MYIIGGLRKVIPSSAALVMDVLVIASALMPPVLRASSSPQGPTVVVEVFPDSSVSWVIEGFKPLNISNRTLGVSGVFLANLTQLEKGMDLLINASFGLKSNATSGEGNVELSLNVAGNTTSTSSIQRSWNVLNASLNIRGKKQALDIRIWSNGPVVTVFNRSDLYAEVKGNLTIVMSGNSTVGMLLALSLLNKGLIEKQLSKANATYIDINELETKVSGTTAVVLFDVGINYTEMIHEMKEGRVKTSAIPEKIRELIESSFIPYNTTYRAEIRVVEGRLKLAVNVHSTLSVSEALRMMLKSFNNSAELLTAPSTPPKELPPTAVPINVTGVFSDINKLIKGLNNVIDKFEILPSSTYVFINITDKGITYRIHTFKIRCKGARTPEDTLKAVAETFREFRGELNQSEMKSEVGEKIKTSVDQALTTEVSLKGMEGVQVTPNKVRLTELDKVNITLPKTQTPESPTALQPTSNIEIAAIAGIAIAAAVLGAIAYLSKK
jgi:hypothetical protein